MDKLWLLAQQRAKVVYEEENGSSWEEADKYEREDYVHAEYERLNNVKENNMAPRDPKTGRFVKVETNKNNVEMKGNDTMKKNNVQNRMETLANAGLDTSKFFQMNLTIPMGAKVQLMVDGKEVVLTGDATKDFAIAEATEIATPGDVHFDEVVNQIMEGGYVNNPRLFRRWICSQMLRMMNYKSYDGQREGYDAYVRDHYNYDYQFKAMADELHRIARMQKDGDPMADECLTFLNRDVVVAVMEDYLRKLKRYVKNTRKNRTRKCRGREYVKLSRYGNVFVDELDVRVYENVQDYIDAINRVDLNNASAIERGLRTFINCAYNKLPYNTSKSGAWKDYYKGLGAYFTLANLVKYHVNKDGRPFMIQHPETGELLTRMDADKYLKVLLNEYKGEGWRFMEMLKKALELHNFELSQSIEMIK